jgi:hypothetical protein
MVPAPRDKCLAGTVHPAPAEQGGDSEKRLRKAAPG